MGFNWRVFLAYWGCIIVAELAFPFLGLTLPQAHLMDVLTTLVFGLLFIGTSRVARHNLAQAFKRNGHQWVGDASECEACTALRGN